MIVVVVGVVDVDHDNARPQNQVRGVKECFEGVVLVLLDPKNGNIPANDPPR